MPELSEILTVLETEWCSLLGVATTSYDDDFFESGGDSLLAIQFAERVEQAVLFPFPLAVLFGDGRFGALADHYKRAVDEHQKK